MTVISPVVLENGYIELPVTTDPSALLASALAAINAVFPGWVPADGSIEEILLEQNAQMAAETAQVAALVAPVIFQYLGQLYGIMPENGAPAVALTTWTMINGAGYAVPAGSVVAYLTAGNVQIQFQTVSSFTTAGRTITAGSLTSGSANLTDPAGSFTSFDVGRSVTGTGVPGATTIISITSPTVAVMSANATATEASEAIVLGNLTATPTGTVEIEAQVVGAVNNGLSDTISIVPVNQLAFVSAIVATAATSGGIDAESISAYLDRLSDLLQISSPRPILPGDFAVLAQSAVDGNGVSLGVYRAAAINNFNPGRTVPNVVLTSGSPLINDPLGGFTNADVGRSITGSIDIPGSTTISAVSTAGRTLSAAALTISSKNLTCSTAAFTANDIGRSVTGTGVAAGSVIASITSGTVAVMNNNATATEASESIVLGALASCQTATMSANATGSTTESVTLGDLSGVGRCCTVAAVDVNGNALSPANEALLSTYLQNRRETGFLVPVISPSFAGNEIDVTWIGLCDPTANPNTVNLAGNAAVAAFLSPALWGGGGLTPPQWDAATTVVKINDIIGVLYAVEGMQSVTSVQIAVHGNSLGTANLTLVGNAPLPTPGTINGSVTAGA